MISFSRRFRASLGRYDMRRKTIRLAAWLRDEDHPLLDEVLCHEAAHAAAFEVYGRRCKPHGPQWKELMRQAGFAPRVRLPERELPAHCRRSPASTAWVHRCPVCNAERGTRRPMRRWRCLRCVRAGRNGKLEITRSAEAAQARRTE